MKTQIKCLECGIESDATACKCWVCGGELVSMTKLDKLTSRYTACRTFSELCDLMQKPGETRQSYSPTIYPSNSYRGRKVAGRVQLIEAVRRAGFKVYDGSRVA